MVRTPGFHPDNMGSIPVGDAILQPLLFLSDGFFVP